MIKIFGWLFVVSIVSLVIFFAKFGYTMWNQGPAGVSSKLVEMFGISIFCVGITFTAYHAALRFLGEQTTGKVVGFRENARDKDGLRPTNISYTEVIEYTTKDGQVIQRESHYSVAETKVSLGKVEHKLPGKVGDTVQIYYDPRNPGASVEIRPLMYLFMFGITAVGIGIILGSRSWDSYVQNKPGSELTAPAATSEEQSQ